MNRMKALIETHGFQSDAKQLENEKADVSLCIQIFDNLFKSLKNSVSNLKLEVQNQKFEILSLNSVYNKMLEELSRQTEDNLQQKFLIEQHNIKNSVDLSLISDDEDCIDLTHDDADENVSSFIY